MPTPITPPHSSDPLAHLETRQPSPAKRARQSNFCRLTVDELRELRAGGKRRAALFVRLAKDHPIGTVLRDTTGKAIGHTLRPVTAVRISERHARIYTQGSDSARKVVEHYRAIYGDEVRLLNYNGAPLTLQHATDEAAATVADISRRNGWIEIVPGKVSLRFADDVALEIELSAGIETASGRAAAVKYLNQSVRLLEGFDMQPNGRRRARLIAGPVSLLAKLDEDGALEEEAARIAARALAAAGEVAADAASPAADEAAASAGAVTDGDGAGV